VDFVMVPVPDDLADKVLTYVTMKGQPRMRPAGEGGEGDSVPSRPGDDAAPAERGPIARVFDRLDEASRRLVAVVAAASLAQEEPTVAEVGRRAGLSTREALGTIVELSYVIGIAGGPPLAVVVTEVEGAEAKGPAFTWDSRVVAMLEPVARSFAELLGIDVTP
jgi:hypothetical protein